MARTDNEPAGTKSTGWIGGAAWPCASKKAGWSSLAPQKMADEEEGGLEEDDFFSDEGEEAPDDDLEVEFEDDGTDAADDDLDVDLDEEDDEL